MPGLSGSLLLGLDDLERLVYLRGLLPFPLSYKTILGVKKPEEHVVLEGLASRNTGFIMKSSDGYDVYVSEARLIAEAFPDIVRMEALELSQRALTVLNATAEAHGYIMRSVTAMYKASSLMSMRRKVDRGRPPLKVDVDVCFLQAGVGSLLQTVLHVPSLYEKISGEDVFKAVKKSLHREISSREVSRLVIGGWL
ncbi:MAG: hypothetical protein F7B59_06700 [Desulfurococcales archaeon]|nr:hypothetical protein [Desulfurococcales archaeon]